MQDRDGKGALAQGVCPYGVEPGLGLRMLSAKLNKLFIFEMDIIMAPTPGLAAVSKTLAKHVTDNQTITGAVHKSEDIS